MDTVLISDKPRGYRGFFDEEWDGDYFDPDVEEEETEEERMVGEQLKNNASPTVRRRQLGGEIKRLRELAGLSAVEFAERIGWSTSKVSRVETGRVSVRGVDLKQALDLLGAPPDDADTLVRLAADGRQKGWWKQFNDVLPEWFDAYLGLESAATLVQNYEAELVPGLLQTKEYAHAVLSAHPTPMTPDEIDRQVALRMSRQTRLRHDSEPLALHTVINEAALHRHIGNPDAMQAQLRHIVEMSELPTVTIQVLPFSAGIHGANNGPFRILEFPEARDHRVVCVDYLVGSVYLETVREVGRYRLLFTRLSEMSLPPSESVAMISRLADET